MSLARVTAFALDGVDSRRVWVEADIRVGLPAFTVVGLADKAVREARERVRSAMQNSGFEFPLRRITVNLAPAYRRKVGPAFDLPLAVSLVVASGQLDPEAIESAAIVGELDLVVFDGRVLVFVEVKTRRSDLRDPWESLHGTKQSKVRRMALSWLHECDRPFSRNLRFDGVAILLDPHGQLIRLDHLEAAF